MFLRITMVLIWVYVGLSDLTRRPVWRIRVTELTSHKQWVRFGRPQVHYVVSSQGGTQTSRKVRGGETMTEVYLYLETLTREPSLLSFRSRQYQKVNLHSIKWSRGEDNRVDRYIDTDWSSSSLYVRRVDGFSFSLVLTTTCLVTGDVDPR